MTASRLCLEGRGQYSCDTSRHTYILVSGVNGRNFALIHFQQLNWKLNMEIQA
jgi:hypothetical protein